MYRIFMIEDDAPLAGAMKKQIEAYVEENTLTANVNRLRKKLESAGLTDLRPPEPTTGL